MFDRVCLSKVSGRCIPHHSQCHSVTVSLYHCYHQYLYQNHLHHYYYRHCYLCHYHHHGPVFCAFPKSYELRLVHNSTQLSTKCRRAWAWAWAWPVAGGGGGANRRHKAKGVFHLSLYRCSRAWSAAVARGLEPVLRTGSSLVEFGFWAQALPFDFVLSWEPITRCAGLHPTQSECLSICHCTSCALELCHPSRLGFVTRDICLFQDSRDTGLFLLGL